MKRKYISGHLSLTEYEILSPFTSKEMAIGCFESGGFSKNCQLLFSFSNQLKWKLKYLPLTKAGKWDLYVWSGTKNCLLNDSCEYSLHLDPWWDSDYDYKYLLIINCNEGNKYCDSNSLVTGSWNGKKSVLAGETRADGMVVISSSGEGIKDIQSELPISISFSERKRDFLPTYD